MKLRLFPTRIAICAMALLAVAGFATGLRSDTLELETTGKAHLPYPGKPYNGAPQAIPGIIQAESYHIAPEGANNITFSYQGESKQTPFRTSPDSIGVASSATGMFPPPASPRRRVRSMSAGPRRASG